MAAHRLGADRTRCRDTCVRSRDSCAERLPVHLGVQNWEISSENIRLEDNDEEGD